MTRQPLLFFCLLSTLLMIVVASSLYANDEISEQTQLEIGREYLALMEGLPKETKLLTSVYPHALTAYGGQSRMVDDADIVGGTAFEVAVIQPSNAASDQGVSLKTIDEIQRGDLLCLTFWARGKSTGFDEGPAILEGVGVQKSKKPYTNLVTKKISLTNDWQQYSFNLVAPKRYRAGQAQVFMHYGSHHQLVQLGPVMLFNLGIHRPRGETRACGKF